LREPLALALARSRDHLQQGLKKVIVA